MKFGILLFGIFFGVSFNSSASLKKEPSYPQELIRKWATDQVKILDNVWQDLEKLHQKVEKIPPYQTGQASKILISGISTAIDNLKKVKGYESGKNPDAILKLIDNLIDADFAARSAQTRRGIDKALKGLMDAINTLQVMTTAVPTNPFK